MLSPVPIKPTRIASGCRLPMSKDRGPKSVMPRLGHKWSRSEANSNDGSLNSSHRTGGRSVFNWGSLIRVYLISVVIKLIEVVGLIEFRECKQVVCIACCHSNSLIARDLRPGYVSA